MSLNQTPSAQRVHIGFFGCRNAGKSSLVNAVTQQRLAVVSDVRGTTTDPVSRAMEILPLGPVVITDTPGYDDEGALGALRMEKTQQVLRRTDVAVLVIDGETGPREADEQLLRLFREREIPCLRVWNKADRFPAPEGMLAVSALEGTNIAQLREQIASLAQPQTPRLRLVGDLVGEGEVLMMITPIDASAPRGRMILPQQQVLRDALDAGAMVLTAREVEAARALEALKRPPRLVVTDSQAFALADALVPAAVPLTSFSILMARSKGLLRGAVEGARALDALREGDRVLICEGCTHHRQCEDIGTVKLPRLLQKHVGAQLRLSFTSGGEFPPSLEGYRVVIHCGGCMLNEREMRYRARAAAEQGVPMTNYGVAIAHMRGILARSVAMFSQLRA